MADAPATQPTAKEIAEWKQRLANLFVCAHAVRLADGEVFVREVCRGEKELCEAMADRGVDDDLDDLSALGNVMEDRMVVHPAAEYEVVMREGRYAQ